MTQEFEQNFKDLVGSPRLWIKPSNYFNANDGLRLKTAKGYWLKAKRENIKILQA